MRCIVRRIRLCVLGSLLFLLVLSVLCTRSILLLPCPGLGAPAVAVYVIHAGAPEAARPKAQTVEISVVCASPRAKIIICPCCSRSHVGSHIRHATSLRECNTCHSNGICSCETGRHIAPPVQRRQRLLLFQLHALPVRKCFVGGARARDAIAPLGLAGGSEVTSCHMVRKIRTKCQR